MKCQCCNGKYWRSKIAGRWLCENCDHYLTDEAYEKLKAIQAAIAPLPVDVDGNPIVIGAPYLLSGRKTYANSSTLDVTGNKTVFVVVCHDGSEFTGTIRAGTRNTAHPAASRRAKEVRAIMPDAQTSYKYDCGCCRVVEYSQLEAVPIEWMVITQGRRLGDKLDAFLCPKCAEEVIDVYAKLQVRHSKEREGDDETQ